MFYYISLHVIVTAGDGNSNKQVYNFDNSLQCCLTTVSYLPEETAVVSIMSA